MTYIDVNTSVDVDDIIDQIDTDDLIAELERRGNDYNTMFVDGDKARYMLDSIWQKKRLNQDFNADLDKLIHYVLGKII